MKLSVCATLISLSLLVGCQNPPSADKAISSTPSTTESIVQVSTQPIPPLVCPTLGIQPVTITVSDLWADGDVITDAYSGKIAQVKNGKITLTPSRHSGGLLLLESEAKKATFQWQSATFYHIATDRYFNGNSWNDSSYGRQKSPHGFKGGDIAGLTKKLDYLAELGVDVLWLTTPLEQVHGWLPSEDGNEPQYPYAGGATLDWTQLDTNMGSTQEMRTFVDLAHQLGMRVVWSMDTKPSQPSLSDLQQFGVYPHNSDRLPSYWSDWLPKEGQNLTHYLDAFKNTNGEIAQWWSPSWFNDNGAQVAITPEFFMHKANTKMRFAHQPKNDLLTQWITHWVAEFGIDGLVLEQSNPQLTAQLEAVGTKVFEHWQDSNAYKALDNGSFQVIDLKQNAPYVPDVLPLDATSCVSQAATQYLHQENNRWNALTWFNEKALSNELHAENYADYRDAASALLLSKGSVSIWYGDESAKSGDRYSMMNWSEMTGLRWSLQSHWKKLLAFRSNHIALSLGEHLVVQSEPYYAFTRTKNNDQVMVVYTGE